MISIRSNYSQSVNLICQRVPRDELIFWLVVSSYLILTDAVVLLGVTAKKQVLNIAIKHTLTNTNTPAKVTTQIPHQLS